MTYRSEVSLEGRTLSIEAGRVARAADGAVWVRYGDTVVLVTAVASKQPREGIDFFPLTVDYQERAYAAGKIPGGFFKREGRPHEKETLAARLIDRPVRPLFPHGYHQDVQIIATVLSADQENDPDVLAVVGASAALIISNIPFLGPIGCVRIGRLDGRFVVNPTYAQLEQSDMDMVLAGTEPAVVMVEGGAREVTEEVLLEALLFGHRALQPIIQIQRDLARQMGVVKPAFVSAPVDPVLRARVEELCRPRIRELAFVPEKEEQQARRKVLLDEALATVAAEPPATALQVKEIFEELEKQEMRRLILEEGRRADGRNVTQVRPITCEVGVLPRTHGSALFTRGQTQALATTTLGTSEDEQRLDDLEGESFKRFMLHYNFPPFSVGEVKFMRGASRRDIGHGALAERAIQPVLPGKEEFPYTVRIVSDILESNGSSSMATVCGASLSLMDAGVPVRAAVAGVAMGLVKEGEKTAVLTDIQGLEDHLGDMDFKVAGTRTGVTSIQMDIKIQGITEAVLRQALGQARQARLQVLDIMEQALAKTAAGAEPLRAADHLLQDSRGQDPRGHRPRRQDHPGDRGADRRQDRRRGRRDRNHRLGGRGGRAEGHGDHRPDRRGPRGRQGLPGQGGQDHGFRRLRGDPAGHGRVAAHLPDLAGADQEGGGRPQGGRGDHGQGDRGGQGGEDPPEPPRAPAGSRREGRAARCSSRRAQAGRG